MAFYPDNIEVIEVHQPYQDPSDANFNANVLVRNEVGIEKQAAASTWQIPPQWDTTRPND